MIVAFTLVTFAYLVLMVTILWLLKQRDELVDRFEQQIAELEFELQDLP